MNKVYLFLFCILCSSSLWAIQLQPNKIIKYKSHEGLAGDIVFDVVQDNYEFMWFATEEGLSKFNGIEFVNYKKNKQLSNTLGENQVTKLYSYGSKMLAATQTGLNVFDMESEQFTQYQHERENPLSLPRNELVCFAKRHNGGVWIGTYGGGACWFDPDSALFHYLDIDYPDKRLHSIYEDKQGVLYIGSHFNGLTIYNPRTKETKYITTSNSLLPDNQIESIIEDSQGNIWIGTWYGLVRWSVEQQTIIRESHPMLVNAKVNSLAEDKSGHLWVGTENYLCSFSLSDQRHSSGFDVIAYHESTTDYGLSYKTVRSVYIDNNNNVWVGLYSGGVNFISRFPQKFEKLIYDPVLSNSLSYKRITSISEDRQGNLLVCTDGAGVDYWDLKTGKIEPIYSTSTNPRLSDNAVLSSLVDSDGDIWIGTYNCVLNRLPKNGNQFIQYRHQPTNPNSIIYSDIQCLFEDSHKRIWVGQRIGLSYFDKQTNQFIEIPQFKWIYVSAFYEIDNSLIIGTHNSGIYKYDFQKGTLEQLSKALHTQICSYYITSIIADKNKHIWIATHGDGLVQIVSQKDSLALYDVNDGLANNFVSAIAEDSQNNLWLSTNEGISKFDPTNRVFENYDMKDGTQPGQFLRNSVLVTSQNKIAFGGAEGINIFDPLSIKKDTLVPNIVFTDFLLFNKSVKIKSEENKTSPLEKNIAFTSQIELSYNESVFTIEYSALNYISPERIKYAYLLEGSDKHWNYVGNRRSATYRNLDPGVYTFKVMASSTDGIFDPTQCKTLTITIAPPFWKTWWAYILYLILFIMTIYLVWNIATIRIRSINRVRYERLKRTQAEELHQAKLQFFTNISHELRTPLTLIIAPLDRMLREEKDPDKLRLLSLMGRNTQRLLHNVNEIMDLRKIERNQMKLRVEQNDIMSFVGNIMLSFEERAAKDNIEFRLDGEQHIMEGYYDPNFIDKILFNLLSNAFKFTPSYGEIIVYISQKNEGFNIEVKDTGKGISEKDIQRIFERFYQVEIDHPHEEIKGTGIGLHLVKSLVTLHKGTIHVASKPNEGSTFSMWIPNTREAYTKEEVRFDQEIDNKRPFYHTSEKSYEDTLSSSSVQTCENSEFKTLLIVEDDLEIRNFLANELSDEFRIIQAENGADGYQKVIDMSPDLIISDVMMPVMDGIALCKKLKTNIETNDIPIILLTAKSTLDDRIEGLEVGADSYIPKPFDMRHLRIRIAKLTELRQLFKEKFKIRLENNNEREQEPKTLSVDELFLENIVQYVLKNIAVTEINGESIADSLCMSRMSLHRKLKALTGLSAGEFIRNIRLEQARAKLQSSGLTISEISYDTGFSSPSYFYTCFLKKYGITPSEYAKQGTDKGSN